MCNRLVVWFIKINIFITFKQDGCLYDNYKIKFNGECPLFIFQQVEHLQ